jgi:hypothetical protein
LPVRAGNKEHFDDRWKTARLHDEEVYRTPRQIGLIYPCGIISR